MVDELGGPILVQLLYCIELHEIKLLLCYSSILFFPESFEGETSMNVIGKRSKQNTIGGVQI